MMGVLIAESRMQLEARARRFSSAFEPVLSGLESGRAAGHRAARLAAVEEYLSVSRWPIRQLEYSFVLEAVERIGGRGLKVLDVGCGAAVLAHVLSRCSHRVHACDYDSDLIAALRSESICELLSTTVEYSRQDATRLDFDSDVFDIVTCVSVLEHVPAPADQQAVREMLRVIKPGGTLLMTIDYAPQREKTTRRLAHYLRRAQTIIRTEGFESLKSAVARKREAARVSTANDTTVPRSANQPFDWRHLERDLLPILRTHGIIEGPADETAVDPRTIRMSDVRRFWELEPGLFERHGSRFVIPVALAVRKPS